MRCCCSSIASFFFRYSRCQYVSRVRVHHLLHVVRRQRRREALQLGVRQQRQRCVRRLVLLGLEDVDLLQEGLLTLLLRLLLAMRLLPFSAPHDAYELSESSHRVLAVKLLDVLAHVLHVVQVDIYPSRG